MADDADRAQEVDNKFQDAVLESYRRRSTDKLESRDTCLNCLRPIPLARQVAIPGVKFCVGCQEIFERWGPL